MVLAAVEPDFDPLHCCLQQPTRKWGEGREREGKRDEKRLSELDGVHFVAEGV
jgi:hypothetical protein